MPRPYIPVFGKQVSRRIVPAEIMPGDRFECFGGGSSLVKEVVRNEDRFSVMFGTIIAIVTDRDRYTHQGFIDRHGSMLIGGEA